MVTFLNTHSSFGIWLLQFVVGVIFIVHGLPKLKNTKKVFGIGSLFHGLVEVIGGIFLFFGFHVRAVGLVFAIIMFGAIWFKKFVWHIPFKADDKTGWEFDLILLAANIFFLIH